MNAATLVSRGDLILGGAARTYRSRLHHARRLAAIGVASALAAGILSAGRSPYTLNVVGNVPVVCNVQFSGPALSDGEGGYDLGVLTEFCNSSSGYQVWLDTDAGLTGTVIIDETSVRLSPAGATLIDSSSQAARKSAHIHLDTAETRLDKLSVRIAPL